MLEFDARSLMAEKNASQKSGTNFKKIGKRVTVKPEPKKPEIVPQSTSILSRTGFQSLGSLQSFMKKGLMESEAPKTIEDIQKFSVLTKKRGPIDRNKKKETSGGNFFAESPGFKEEKTSNPVKVLLNDDSADKRANAARRIADAIIKELGAEFMVEGEDKRAQAAFDLEERFVTKFKHKPMDEKLELYQKLLEMITSAKPRFSNKGKSLLRKQYKSEAEKDKETLDELVQEYWICYRGDNDGGTLSPKSQNSQSSSLKLLRQQSSLSQSNNNSGMKALGASGSGSTANPQSLAHGKSMSSKVFQPVDEVLGSLDSEGDKNVRNFFHIHQNLKAVWGDVVTYGETEMIENIFQVADVFSGHTVQDAHEMQASGLPIAKECLELVESSTWDAESSLKIFLISDEKEFKMANLHLRTEPKVAVIKDIKISSKFTKLSLNCVRFSEMDLLYLGARMSHSATQLQKIKLEKLEMTENCHVIFRELLSKIPLQSLTIKHCEISSKNFALYNEKLASLPIKNVSFPFNSIDDNGILTFCPIIKYVETLERFDLRGNPFGEEARRELKKAIYFNSSFSNKNGFY